MSRNNNMQKIKSFYDVKDLLWNLYPAYVLYNKYILLYYVSSILHYLNLTNKYPYMILSLFNDNPCIDTLSYLDYCLAYNTILSSFILYLLDIVIIRNKLPKFAIEGAK